MKHISILSFCLLMLCMGLHAQKPDVENTYEFETMRKKANLRNVAYDPSTGNTTLTYLENNLFDMYFRDYVFDKDLKFIEEKEVKFNFGEKINWESDADAQRMRDQYPWFNYQGESYEVSYIDVWRTLDGKLRVRNATMTYTYNWNWGVYVPTINYGGSVKLGGENDERLYPYERAINTKTGDLYLLVGIKRDKGDKAAKFQHCRKFQVVKISPKMEISYLDEINFDFNVGINYTSVVTPNNEPLDIIDGMFDISQGKWYVMFSPIKTMIGGKFGTKDPGAHTLAVIAQDGSLEKTMEIRTETSGWVIEGLVAANNGKDVYMYGPAKDGAFVNKLQPTNSPLTFRDELKDIKYKNFQVMKLSDNEMKWISSTDLKEFQAKNVTPPSQKKSPTYSGRNMDRSVVYVTPGGELFIGGQNYTTTKVPDPEDRDAADGQDMIKVRDKFKDLIMFHFAADGNLKAQYGVRRDFNNKHAKATLTPQGVYLSRDGKSLYWVYDEIKGYRPGFSLGVSTLGGLANTNAVLSKAKLLTFPAVSKIDLNGGSMTDFNYLGVDEKGKNEYYTHPTVGAQVSGDGDFLTFVGEDRQGKVIWLARMPLK